MHVTHLFNWNFVARHLLILASKWHLWMTLQRLVIWSDEKGSVKPLMNTKWTFYNWLDICFLLGLFKDFFGNFWFCVLGLLWFWKDWKNIALACFGFVPKMQRDACRVWWLAIDRCFRHIMSYMIISIYILYIICLNATHVYKIETILSGILNHVGLECQHVFFYDHWTF